MGRILYGHDCHKCFVYLKVSFLRFRKRSSITELKSLFSL
ncbi:rCG37674, partial [Rattus norvegicus]